MSNHIFTGSGVALITPMKSDGSVNYDVLGDLVETVPMQLLYAVQQVRLQLFRKKSIAKQFLSLQKRQTAEFLLLQVQAVTIPQQPLCSQNLPQAQALTHFSA